LLKASAIVVAFFREKRAMVAIKAKDQFKSESALKACGMNIEAACIRKLSQ
jgi:hypothetical protein